MRIDRFLQNIAIVLAVITIFQLVCGKEMWQVNAEVLSSSYVTDNDAVEENVPATEETIELTEETCPPFVFEEQITEVPLYFQADYAKTPYGGYGTVASHGCGITSVAMVFSYLLDREMLPDALAKEFGRYNTEVGSSYTLFPASAETYGLSTKQTYNWDEVVNALEEGHLVIANPTKNIFTKGGHYIVLYGITDDGKILVRDPNKYNYPEWNEWCGSILEEGFQHGFDQKYLKYSCLPCWIYPLKDMEAIEQEARNEYLDSLI